MHISNHRVHNSRAIVHNFVAVFTTGIGEVPPLSTVYFHKGTLPYLEITEKMRCNGSASHKLELSTCLTRCCRH